MSKRDVSLSKRTEETRDQIINELVHFKPQDIKSHFEENMKIVKEQFVIADELNEAGNDTGCCTIWRSQVVLAESALDFYIHEVSKYALFQMFCGNWDKTEKYYSIMVSMRYIEEAMRAKESEEWFFGFLNGYLSRQVFLSVDNMRDQLNLIGIDFKEVMVRAFPKKNEQESIECGKKIIKNLFQRRNEIAHQNDRSHYNAEQMQISKAFVEKCVYDIEKIIEAVQAMMDERDV